MKQKPHKILFVCLGNICRSPAAEAVMQQLVDRAGLHDNFVIDSAGTYGGHAGEPADRRMRQAASKRGYALTSRSRKITPDDFETFDRIVVMADSISVRVHRLAPSVAFCRRSDATYVPDPYYEGHEGFELVLDLLEDACEGLLEDLVKQE